MSDSASRLPARPSLEHLRKQAKDRLRALRAEDPSAKLADAQFAVAREYGFESWPRLVDHVEAVNPPGLREYKQLAEKLADAYQDAEYDTIRKIGWEYGASYYSSRDVTRMHEQLPTWFASDDRDPGLALADARNLVGKQAGFDDWDGLVRSLAEPPLTTDAPWAADSPGTTQTRPGETRFYLVDRERGTIQVRGPLSRRHWDTIIAVISEEGLTGLSGDGMTDSALERVSQLTQLTRLETGGGRLTDKGVRHLAVLSGLEELTLGGPKSEITDLGLEVLRHLPSLRKFEIGWAPKISDAGVANLRFCDDLESVNLLGTPTGDGAIAAVGGKSRLSHLMTGRLVSDEGIRRLQDVPRFKTWHGGEPEYSLMNFGAKPTHLLLDGRFTNRGVGAMEGLDGLFGLDFFWHTSSLTAGALEPLGGLANLGYLGCQGQLCDDEAMRHIAALPHLRMLMGQGSVATDDGFTALSRSETIEHIWGRECPNLTGRGFAALASMPALAGLGVSCKNVDDASLATLPTFPALRALMPMDVPDEGFRHVGRCEQLEELWCMYCRDTGDAATEHIADLPKLRTYYAGSTQITDRSLEILGRMASLESVTLMRTSAVTDEGVKALSKLPRLREVSLGGLSRVTRHIVTAFPARIRVSYEP